MAGSVFEKKVKVVRILVLKKGKFQAELLQGSEVLERSEVCDSLFELEELLEWLEETNPAWTKSQR